jgi:hypothetical protein
MEDEGAGNDSGPRKAAGTCQNPPSKASLVIISVVTATICDEARQGLIYPQGG